MLVIRPITLEDLDAVAALADAAGPGLTTLPRDVKLLRRRMRASLRGFEKLADEDPPRGETYLFVLQDTSAGGRVVGTSGIVSKVGGFEPFYSYRVETTAHECRRLGVRKEVPTLHLAADHDGPCEIGSLFLSAPYRRDGNGRLLSLARFLFMADHAEYFDPVVIAEMRGVVDDAGRSPFWEAVGRHFFDVEYATADGLCMDDKRFIADLMPRHPIYVPLLPMEAQDVIGRVHPETEPAMRLLEGEGFRRCGTVDIFDAGPVVRCDLKEIRGVRCSRRMIVEEVSEEPAAGTPMIVSNARQDFRACKGTVEVTAGGGGRIDAEVAAALRVKPGDAIRFVTARATDVEGAPDHGARGDL